MIQNNLTDSIQDYLKAIYGLTIDGSPASTSALAEYLNVKPASVTGMLQRLAAAKTPLLTYRKHRGVVLTPEGQRAALEVIRHHRLLETYLQQTLGYTWDEVHDEADRLEHVISEDLEKRIDSTLGNPARDPHGEPIPTRDLSMPVTADTPLNDLRAGQSATLRRVRPSSPELLRYLDELGLLPGTRIEILDYSALDHNLRLRIHGKDETIVLGFEITSQIFVEVVK
jgi:DtxR family Mn-dependent transcriptional regulator